MSRPAWLNFWFLAPRLILVAAIAISAGSRWVGRREALAVSVATTLKPGVTRTPPFRAEYDDLYLVGLRMAPTLGGRDTACLAGVRTLSPLEPDRCTDRRVRLVWRIQADDGRAQHGVYPIEGESGASFGGSEYVTVHLGAVSLKPGRSYVLTVHSLADGSALAAAHPRFVMEADGPASKADMVKRLLAGLAAFALAAIGLVWLLAMYALAYARRRRSGVSQPLSGGPR